MASRNMASRCSAEAQRRRLVCRRGCRQQRYLLEPTLLGYGPRDDQVAVVHWVERPAQQYETVSLAHVQLLSQGKCQLLQAVLPL